MYKLGEHFELDKAALMANPGCVFQGQKYRITVLSEMLVRLEFNENGVFEDRPTKLVRRRNFKPPKFTVKQDDVYLEITTSYFKLYYTKEKNFYGGKVYPGANLNITLINGEKAWYYKHPEVRNYGAPQSELFNKRGKYKFTKGLYSIDGFASVDDSENEVINEGGEFVEREEDVIDTYVFMYYKNYQQCLKDYFYLTGSPALIPRYALGNWWSRNEDYDDDSLKTLIDTFELHDIPLSILLLNHDWHLKSYDKVNNIRSAFTFDESRFKSPENMIKFLHSKGIRVGLSVDPLGGFYPFETNYAEISKHLTPDKDGKIPFNVLDSKALDVYLKLIIHYLDAVHIDFYWLNLDSNLKEEKFRLNHYHFNDMKRNYKRRPMLLSENSNIAPHRYPVLYSGKTTVDWKTLEAIPFFNSSATNNGVSWWSHDIGGYHEGIEEDELYIRFVQLGVFSPILKFGSERGMFYKREPWRWNTNTFNIAKEYLRLRHRLIPYLYSEAYKYHKDGKPLLEPVYYKYPEMYDDKLYRNEYYFGSELFVCPIISRKEEIMKRAIHHFYMPEGVWYDYVTGKRFPGPDNYVSFFTDQQYPVFAKAGSIIPLGENDNIFDTTPPKNIEIHIFPGRSNTYELYEDDGMTDLYRKGFYLKTSIEFKYESNNYNLTIRPREGKSGIVPDKRNFKIRFRNTKRAENVTATVKAEDKETNTYNEGNDFIIEIKDVPSTAPLILNCSGKNIEIDALHIINDDIQGIISDLLIETDLKQMVYDVLFGKLPPAKKRIAVRKLRRKGLENKFVKLFLKLLEYIEQV